MIRFNEGTWYSRLISFVLFLGFIPALSFYIGTQYQLLQGQSYVHVQTMTAQKDDWMESGDITQLMTNILNETGISGNILTVPAKHSTAIDSAYIVKMATFQKSNGDTSQEDMKKYVTDYKQTITDNEYLEHIKSYTSTLINYFPKDKIDQALKKRGFEFNHMYSGDGGPNFSVGYQKDSTVCIVGGSQLPVTDWLYEHKEFQNDYNENDYFGYYDFQCFKVKSPEVKERNQGGI